MGVIDHDLTVNGTTPTLAYIQNGMTRSAVVSELDTGAWTSLDPAAISGASLRAISVAVHASAPHVAVSTGLFQDNLKVFRRNGATWSELGSPGATSACSAHESIGLALDGAIPLLTSFGAGGCGLGVDFHWLQGTWQSHASTTTFPAQLTMSANGHSDIIITDRPYVALSDNGTHWVRYWDDGASAWQNLGSSLSVNASTGFDEDIVIAADSTGQLYAAWSETNASNLTQIWVKTYTTDWTSVGGKVSGPLWASSPSLALIGDVPWVAYVESDNGLNKVFVRRWTGSNWELVGGALNDSAFSAAGDPVIVDVSGTPHVAFREPLGSGLEHLYVKSLQ